MCKNIICWLPSLLSDKCSSRDSGIWRRVNATTSGTIKPTVIGSEADIDSERPCGLNDTKIINLPKLKNDHRFLLEHSATSWSLRGSTMFRVWANTLLWRSVYCVLNIAWFQRRFLSILIRSWLICLDNIIFTIMHVMKIVLIQYICISLIFKGQLQIPSIVKCPSHWLNYHLLQAHKICQNFFVFAIPFQAPGC